MTADLVAVTGATGFVGQNLVPRLVAEGFRVRALMRPCRSLEGVERVTGNLDSAAALDTLVKGARFVFHLAGRVAAPNEAAFDRANVEGTRSVVKAAEAAGVERFVHVSSLAVTGPARRGEPVDETTTPKPVTPYGRSKLRGEGVIRESGFPWVIARPCAVYGPHDRAFLDLFKAASTLGVAPVIGDGLQELSLIHVHDLCDALVRLALAPSLAVEGKTFHVAHAEPTTQLGLAEAVGRAVGRKVRVVRVPVPIFSAYAAVTGTMATLRGRDSLIASWKIPEYVAPAWTCEVGALETAIGFVARRNLEEGASETARWYQSEGLLDHAGRRRR